MASTTLNLDKIRVGIIRGGPSPEYEISLKTGANVKENLPENFIPVDILISKDGFWNRQGEERPAKRVLNQVDVVFNALHGKYGEDGKLQNLLDTFNKPYTGSKTLSSAIAMHKGYSKAIFEMNSIKTPVYLILNHTHHTKREIGNLFKSFPQPSVVKPASGGSSLSTTIVLNLDSLFKAVEDAFRHGPQVIVEEYISGSEATCAVLESDDGGIFALEPIEIVPASGRNFFDYEAKYENKCEEIVPARFGSDLSRELQRLAIEAHKLLGLRHYSRSDFIVSAKRGIYILETNSLPGLTEESLYPKALNAAGISMSEFISHVLNLAMK